MIPDAPSPASIYEKMLVFTVLFLYSKDANGQKGDSFESLYSSYGYIINYSEENVERFSENI